MVSFHSVYTDTMVPNYSLMVRFTKKFDILILFLIKNILLQEGKRMAAGKGSNSHP